MAGTKDGLGSEMCIRDRYVVSSTLDEPRWSNSTVSKGAVLKGSVVNEVSKLKQELDLSLIHI